MKISVRVVTRLGGLQIEAMTVDAVVHSRMSELSQTALAAAHDILAEAGHQLARLMDIEEGLRDDLGHQ